jgi:glycerate dehydrogenase
VARSRELTDYRFELLPRNFTAGIIGAPTPICVHPNPSAVKVSRLSANNYNRARAPIGKLVHKIMNIVVLDGYTLNPGDLDWSTLRALGDCEIYDRTAPNQIPERAANAEILFSNKVQITREHLLHLDRLRYIGVLATGTNNVDLVAARERKIIVTNVPAYGTQSVAQATLALLLELTNHAGQHTESVRKGNWTKSADWCYWETPLVELTGLTMGIVGYGRIGQAVGQLAAAFGMNVLASSSTSRKDQPPARFVNLETLFRQSDVVSLHCPLTPQTERLVDAQRLSWMKPTAFLLNTSRGQLVDEAALAEWLNSGKIAGAGLDVLSAEPPPANQLLLRARNCLITPHQAWATHAARRRLLDIAVENLRAFLAGRPQNVVT